MFAKRIKKISKRAALLVLALAFVCAGMGASSNINAIARAHDGDNDCSEPCQFDLVVARAATSQYHNVRKAFKDGFISTQFCVSAPGLGAMGIHFINPARMANPAVDESEPEVLLYLSDGLGNYKLVALEYFVPVKVNGQPWFGPGPPPSIDNPAPKLFGRTFDGPMPGHGPGEPWHYDLHVWAWKHNPSGLFAPFNPKLSCEAHNRSQ